MAGKVVSLRLPEELLGWATEYAAGRGVSRTEIVEAALRAYREDSRAGVPDLPERVQAVKPQVSVAGVTTARALLRRRVDPDAVARQAKLNQAKARNA